VILNTLGYFLDFTNTPAYKNIVTDPDGTTLKQMQLLPEPFQ
jgi:hypothetical protein